MLGNRFRNRDSSETSVTSILMWALIFGLAVGFPAGYFARQAHASASNSNLGLASLQQK